jgi:hypothetical protein
LPDRAAYLSFPAALQNPSGPEFRDVSAPTRRADAASATRLAGAYFWARTANSSDIPVPQTIIWYPEVSPLMDLAKLVGDLVSVLAFLLVVGAIVWFVITQLLSAF